ncbi:MAG: hypothetical protein FWC58_01200 [Desulfobulbus sp.]|nr:hypothetical protein [Desulfobulbus sp.]
MPGPLILLGAVVEWAAVRAVVVRLLAIVWSLLRSAPSAVAAFTRWLAGFGTIGAVVDALTDGAISAFWGGFAGVTAMFLNVCLGTDSFKTEEFEGNIRRGFSLGAGREIAKQSGIQLRDILDKEMVLEDLESFALEQIKERTGMELHSLRNVEAIKRDFATIAQGVIAEKVGLPLSNLLDPDTTRNEIMDWAQDIVMMRISDSVSEALAAQVKKGGTTLLKTIQDKIGKKVTGRSLLLGVHDAMASRYMVRWEAFRQLSKKDKRKLQNKIAQRRFRDKANPKSEIYAHRNGGKMQYVPVGCFGKVEEPNMMGYASGVSAKAKSALTKIKDKLHIGTGTPKPAAPPAGPTVAQTPDDTQ